MVQISFATKNKGKVAALQDVLSKYDIEVVQFPLEIPEPRSDDLREIAGEKVRFAYGKIRKPCVALDGGFYINSLNGFPGPFTKFFLGKLGVAGILKQVKGERRECEFRECLAYLDDGLADPKYFESVSGGLLAESPRGKSSDVQWSDLSLVFVPDGETKTVAEMSRDELYAWRGRRYRHSFSTKFAEWFAERSSRQV